VYRFLRKTEVTRPPSCPTRTARRTSSSFDLIARADGNPGSAALQSGNVPNPLRFVADQQMSRWSANETEDAMKRTIVVTVALLASALSAHAAPVKKHLRVANGRACHRIVVTKDNAVSYALGIASGQIPLPQMDELRRCYPRTRDNAGSDEVNRNLSLGIP
jgi:hypothetical protein